MLDPFESQKKARESMVVLWPQCLSIESLQYPASSPVSLHYIALPFLKRISSSKKKGWKMSFLVGKGSI